MSKETKVGMIFMGAWILFLLVLYSSYLYATGKSVSYFIDEETGGFISLAFFVAWALIWFGIGRHYCKDYMAKREVYQKQFPLLDADAIDKAFREEYFSKIAKMLAGVFACAVPFYVAANVRGEVTVRNCIYVGILMCLSLLLYRYYKKHTPDAES